MFALGLAALPGCAIHLAPQTAELKESPKPPIFRLDKITESSTGAWSGGGFRPYLTNALNKPAPSSLFTKDSTGLAMRIEIKAAHEDDGPRLMWLGVKSILTLGILPLHYRSEWPVTCDVTIRSDDGNVLARYSVSTTGVYDIWAYPFTMFSLFGASMRGDSDGRKALERTAGDLVSQIMREADADYPRLAAIYRSQTMARSDGATDGQEPAVVRSDIDDLPQAKARQNKRSYAVVVGIERYRQKLPRADFAGQDASAVTDYLTRVLGFPEENVVTLANDQAALGDFVKYFEKWLPNNVEQDGTVFVYYSGHGAPDPKSGAAYLVPYDGDPSFIDQTGYSLKRLYGALAKLPAREVIVVLDSCFSGAGGRSVLAEGARPLVMKQTADALPPNITVLAASSGEQISSTYRDKGHGLFTYFLLKGIKNEEVVNTDGTLEVRDLYDYVKPQVTSIARKKYNNEQTPQLIEAKGK
jgi:hypothetical protein